MSPSNVIPRLQRLLASEEAIPEKDAAGVIDPKGVDAKARVQAVKDCISIVTEELNVLV